MITLLTTLVAGGSCGLNWPYSNWSYSKQQYWPPLPLDVKGQSLELFPFFLAIIVPNLYMFMFNSNNLNLTWIMPFFIEDFFSFI